MITTAVSLEIREASVFYGANRVLDRVSLSAAGGEFIALLGASGCGKTTLLRAICGFVGLASGSIVVGGQDVTRHRRSDRQVLPIQRMAGSAGHQQSQIIAVCARTVSSRNGHRRVASLDREKVKEMLANRASTPSAANNWLDHLRLLMRLAIDLKMRTDRSDLWDQAV